MTSKPLPRNSDPGRSSTDSRTNVVQDSVPMGWWDGMYKRRLRLLKPYERDMEWWVASGADPAWVTYPVGEEFDCSDDEADALIADGTAVEVEKPDAE